MTNDTKALKQALQRQFPPTDTIPRPTKVDEWDGETAALRYPMKPDFERRISTNNGKRFNKKTGKHRKCRDTDNQPLKSKDKLELLIASRHYRDSGKASSKEGPIPEPQRVPGLRLCDQQSKARVRENEGKDEIPIN